MSTTPADPRPTPRPLARTVSAGLALLESLVLTGFTVFYVAELVIGGGDDAARVVTSAIVIVITALGLAYLARGWWGAATWARTPTLVWNVLLLPIGVSLLQSGQPVIGILVLVVAVLSLVASVASGTSGGSGTSGASVTPGGPPRDPVEGPGPGDSS